MTECARDVSSLVLIAAASGLISPRSVFFTALLLAVGSLYFATPIVNLQGCGW